MKDTALRLLWDIAQGVPQQQGEKTLYPNFREQIAALTFICKLEGWEGSSKASAVPEHDNDYEDSLATLSDEQLDSLIEELKKVNSENTTLF